MRSASKDIAADAKTTPPPRASWSFDEVNASTPDAEKEKKSKHAAGQLKAKPLRSPSFDARKDAYLARTRALAQGRKQGEGLDGGRAAAAVAGLEDGVGDRQRQMGSAAAASGSGCKRVEEQKL